MVSRHSTVRSGTLTWREWGLWTEEPPCFAITTGVRLRLHTNKKTRMAITITDSTKHKLDLSDIKYLNHSKQILYHITPRAICQAQRINKLAIRSCWRYIGFTPSVHPASRVRSVAPTALVGSISYLYILSSNFRRCVVYKVSCKISKFLAIV